MILLMGTVGIAICQLVFSAHSAQAQEPAAAASAGDTTTIHVETREVPVDTVVTDKKGNYVRDLAVKDFKVWEDNKEQPIKNFSFQEGTASGKEQKQYLVLLFDNSTMDAGDLVIVRRH
jgi:hypothetical protein